MITVKLFAFAVLAILINYGIYSVYNLMRYENQTIYHGKVGFAAHEGWVCKIDKWKGREIVSCEPSALQRQEST